MIPYRLKYGQIAPEGIKKMQELEHFLSNGTGIEIVLLELVRLLSSLRNDCEFCIGLHSRELRNRNESEERIAALGNWRESTLYTPRERAALDWTEAVTDIQHGHAPDPVYDELRVHFTDVEVVNLTLVITTINAWNRIAISLGSHSHRGDAA